MNVAIPVHPMRMPRAGDDKHADENSAFAQIDVWNTCKPPLLPDIHEKRQAMGA